MIIIPMAGLSSRFTRAGYNLPKYMLPLYGESVFTHSVKSFTAYFKTIPFIFIARAVADAEDFLKKEINKLGIKEAHIVILNHETTGQAETVEIGIKKFDLNLEQPLTIFNIDTFRDNFLFPNISWFKNSDGYLEVFKGDGNNWSYVEPKKDCGEPLVIKTTEKQPVSDLCCDGLYHFARAQDFLYALTQERLNPSASELYVAPLYNHLIKRDYKIHYNLIPKNLITFCGVPTEYDYLLKNL
ncbi:glycosyltransferase family 2 protein [Oecophyllibacter saccharovorans]|uniref:Capsular biosynthesis protein n=1 Tax=Oecophyllibacter saccharovorans TaxID=2558360 RepID=A0A506URV9_9PROT|nr:glycosyltransferase family 2 protein [Oecophyllibacter saccharovorans]TPW36085.1 capsular biosynthesis protein [Oecophyllibacter saccharovorans]